MAETSPPSRHRRRALRVLLCGALLWAAAGCGTGGHRDVALETGAPDPAGSSVDSIVAGERSAPVTRAQPRATVPTRVPLTTGTTANATIAPSTTVVPPGTAAPPPSTTVATTEPAPPPSTTTPAPPTTTSTAPPGTTAPAVPTTSTSVPSVVLAGGTRLARTVLVDGTNRSLYVSLADVGGTATCLGSCTLTWAPLSGTVSAHGAGVGASLIGSVTRSDGVVQLTYAGRPLYRLVDETVGQATGQGRDGTWYLIDLAGVPVTS